MAHWPTEEQVTIRVRRQYSAGALVRRHLRAALDSMGAEWREYKGWLDSEFVVTATLNQHRRLEA
jgi:hypothetical protein